MSIRFMTDGSQPTQPPNPAYPDGIDIDLSAGALGCWVDLPDYPAPSRGAWLIECKKCGHRAVVTAAGRPDDPRRVKQPCLVRGSA